MDWLNNFIKNNPVLSLVVPSLLSGANFFGNLIVALSDGQIDSNELHQLMGSANGVQMLLLVVIMVALKKKDKE